MNQPISWHDQMEAAGAVLPNYTEPVVTNFNDRKFQFILDYCIADRRSGNGDNLQYSHHQHNLIQTASVLYDKALDVCQ